MIHLYNSLTRKKEEFKPMEEGTINMYVCGPTVYDVPHIGHVRSSYSFDVIRRYFEYVGYKVCFVRNITDIDDKIIKKAVTELEDMGESIAGARLRQRVKEVAERYLKIYHQEMDILGIRVPDVEPKATENIDKMILFIQKLIEKGYAYVVGGNVYFNVLQFKEYGKLSNRDMEDLMHGVRVDVDQNKKHPVDFALWKEAKESEPFWESPWGRGRPGWHIECSVMSTSILGAQFDIHGGGLDLIFPHHENEIAQAEAATDKPFANYWIHNGLLTVSGEKMSKSLGNYVSIEDFLEKYKDPELLKLVFINSHYRSPVDYSEEKVISMKRSKERVLIFLGKADRLIKENAGIETEMMHLDSEAVGKAQWEVNTLQEKFEDAMNDDFNSPAAMSVIYEAVKTGNDCISDNSLNPGEKAIMVNALRNCVLRFSGILGISFRAAKVGADEEAEIEGLVQLRQEAREKKDFKGSDRIRDILLDKGIIVEDTPEGSVWRKK